jgi:beta-lactamase regulating signal transducer with metallopeptidase domain
MNAVVERLGWTLIHSVWELGLIWLGFKGLVGALGSQLARTKYIAGCTTLVLCAMIPWFTYVRLGAVFRKPAAILDHASASPLPVHEASGLSTASVHSWDAMFQAAMSVFLPWLVLLWVLGCGWGAFHLLVDWRSSRRLLDEPYGSLPDEIMPRFRHLAQRIGIQRAVRHGESMLVEVPSLVGWLKPLILIPTGAFVGLTTSQVDAILAHELAHVLRNDFPVTLFQSICEIVFFYHPAIHAINDQINLEREKACDDIAVGLTGDPIGFAEALAKLEEARAPRLALAATGGSHLLLRVRRLLGRAAPPVRTRASSAWATLCGVAIYAALFLFAPRAVIHAGPPSSGLASINFYEVAEGPREGFSAMIEKDGLRETTFYVGQIPDLEINDIARAHLATAASRRPVLLITFTPEGRDKFRILTRERSAGGKTSIEAIVINAVLVSTPSVRQEIDAPSAVIESANPDGLAQFETFIRALPPDKRD